jgi:hypothetical protein
MLMQLFINFSLALATLKTCRMVPFGPTSPPQRRAAPEVLAKPEAQIGNPAPQIRSLEPQAPPPPPPPAYGRSMPIWGG